MGPLKKLAPSLPPVHKKLAPPLLLKTSSSPEFGRSTSKVININRKKSKNRTALWLRPFGWLASLTRRKTRPLIPA